MPIPGARYRVHTTSKGKKVRLAFRGNRVVEAKNLKTGATHTPAEFAADRAKSRTRPSLASHVTRLRQAGHFARSARP
jgi:hypothetical protein